MQACFLHCGLIETGKGLGLCAGMFSTLLIHRAWERTRFLCRHVFYTADSKTWKGLGFCAGMFSTLLINRDLKRTRFLCRHVFYSADS